MTPRERREKKLAEIDARHDWLQGQVRGRGGTRLEQVDRCQLCNLLRDWESDEQNDVSKHVSFRSALGGKLSILEAAELPCGEE